MLSDAAEDLQPVAAWQHNIQHNDIELFCVDPEEGILAGVRYDSLVPFVFEALLQSVRDFDFVFDNEDSHSCCLRQ